MKKFEVKQIGEDFVIWNNDMNAPQYIYAWSGTTTNSKNQADAICKNLNHSHENK